MRLKFALVSAAAAALFSMADGAVTGDDAIAFGNAYIAGAPEADVDENELIQPSDVLLFQEAYTCGCGSP